MGGGGGGGQNFLGGGGGQGHWGHMIHNTGDAGSGVGVTMGVRGSPQKWFAQGDIRWTRLFLGAIRIELSSCGQRRMAASLLEFSTREIAPVQIGRKFYSNSS